jgi:mannose/fructose/N-acetylgalactosamine-specific phosphotransferase system component IIB
MPIVLFRVDERLIHGQVVVGWGGPLHADRMVVIDDDLAASPWEQELYCLGVPSGINADFVSVEEARRAFVDWKKSPLRSILLVRNVDTLRRVAEQGTLRGQQVNLGGIHHGAGRRRVLPYLFLSPEEENDLKRIVDDGATIAAQDLPASRSILLDQLLER